MRLKEFGVRVGPDAVKKALGLMLQCIATGKGADRPDLLGGVEELIDLVGYRRINHLDKSCCQRSNWRGNTG